MFRSNEADGAAGRQLQEEQRGTSHKHTRPVRAEAQERDGALSEEWSGCGRDVSHTEERKMGRRPIDPVQSLEDELRRKLADASRHTKQNEREMDDLKKRLDKEEQQSQRLRRERDLWRQDANELRDKLTSSIRESNVLKMDVHDLQNQLARSKSLGRGLEDRLQGRDKDIKTVQAELHRFRAQYDRTRTLLETRTSELKGAQTFLTKADSLSGAEVTTMVEGLNSEILQTAAFIADSFEFELIQAHSGAVLDAANKAITNCIGANTLHLLTSTRHTEDPMLIQIAVQSCLVRYSKDIITTWCFNMIPDQFLVEVYERMRQSEDQAVSGRWRALTRNYCRPLIVGDTIASSIPAMIDSLTNVLIVAACKEPPPHIHDKVMSMFGDRIRLVANLALQLNQALGQQVTSSDLEIAYVEEDVGFDPRRMIDICDDDAARNSARVICTTELGLLQLEKESKGDTCLKQTILLKPKVALNSVVDSAARK